MTDFREDLQKLLEHAGVPFKREQYSKYKVRMCTEMYTIKGVVRIMFVETYGKNLIYIEAGGVTTGFVDDDNLKYWMNGSGFGVYLGTGILLKGGIVEVNFEEIK